jgi:Domain of unknown function (DUF4276)
MARLNLIGEGSTEESFVRLVLSPFLGERGTYAVARSVETSRRHGTIRRGGMTRYARARGDIVRWLKQDHLAYVTTMFDFYALPKDFPGFSSMPAGTVYDKVRHVEAAVAADIGDDRFIPYLQLHEFEGLLFSDVEVIDSELAIETGDSRLPELETMIAAHATPEHINDGYMTCPSRRLVDLFPRYQKPTDGIRISERIGIQSLRSKCVHFDEWVTRLITLT